LSFYLFFSTLLQVAKIILLQQIERTYFQLTFYTGKRMKGSKLTFRFIILFYLAHLLISTPIYSQDPTQSLINVSKITSWVDNRGIHDWIVAQGWNGAYPSDLPVGVIFSEGMCWGGLVYDGQDQKVRVNGNTYGTGCSSIKRLFRVRTDYYKTDLTNDAASFFDKDKKDVTEEDITIIKNQYEKTGMNGC
jgi:hypothetical protein